MYYLPKNLIQCRDLIIYSFFSSYIVIVDLFFLHVKTKLGFLSFFFLKPFSETVT